MFYQYFIWNRLHLFSSPKISSEIHLGWLHIGAWVYLLSIYHLLSGGLVAYNMPQGERRGNEVDLYDFTYDGEISKNYLSNGLGQLTDGIEGHSNFRQDSYGIGKKGYQWIGWKSDLREQPSINIIFEFDSIRNFTSARFHCNNMYSKDVRVFRRAVLYFGVTSGWFQEKPVVFDYMRDMLMESSRYVIISIPHRVGKFIRAELYFDAKWLMLSEVVFESSKYWITNECKLHIFFSFSNLSHHALFLDKPAHLKCINYWLINWWLFNFIHCNHIILGHL